VGDADVVAILGANRPEWVISALGAMRIGGISAGIYTTCSADEIGYILGHSESPVIVVETNDQLSRVMEAWADAPALRTVVMMEGADPVDDERVLAWDEFLAKADGVEDDLDARLDALRPDQVADFIYTSGTTGPPKAVMLTHDNLEWTARTIGSQVKLGADETALSYLPLSHIAEQTSSMLMPLVFGYEVWFCHDGLQLAQYLPEVRPTTFFGVPRVWERFEAGIKSQLSQATGAKAKIAEWGQGVALKYHTAMNAGETPSGALQAQYRIADKLLLSKIHGAIGLDRCRILVSGAAPIPAATLEFFASVGLPVLELYGQSEDSGPTSTNLPGANRFGTVGRALEGVGPAEHRRKPQRHRHRRIGRGGRRAATVPRGTPHARARSRRPFRRGTRSVDGRPPRVGRGALPSRSGDQRRRQPAAGPRRARAELRRPPERVHDRKRRTHTDVQDQAQRGQREVRRRDRRTLRGRSGSLTQRRRPSADGNNMSRRPRVRTTLIVLLAVVASGCAQEFTRDDAVASLRAGGADAVTSACVADTLVVLDALDAADPAQVASATSRTVLLRARERCAPSTATDPAPGVDVGCVVEHLELLSAEYVFDSPTFGLGATPEEASAFAFCS